MRFVAMKAALLAVTAAAAMTGAAAALSAPPAAGRIEVVDEAGGAVLTLPFADAVEIELEPS